MHFTLLEGSLFYAFPVQPAQADPEASWVGGGRAEGPTVHSEGHAMERMPSSAFGSVAGSITEATAGLGLET